MKKLLLITVMIAGSLVTNGQTNDNSAMFPPMNGTAYSMPSDYSFNIYNYMSFATWINPSNIVFTYPRLICRTATAGGNQNRWQVSFEAMTGKVVFGSEDVAMGSTALISNTALTGNNLQHVAVTFDNGEVKIYIDGVLDAVTTISWGSLNATSGLPIRIGAEANGYNHYSGLMDEVGLWTRTLSAQEVADLMTCPPDFNDADLRFYYNMEDVANQTTLVDQSSYSNHASIVDVIQKVQTAIPYGTCCNVNTSVTQNGNALTVDEAGLQYQWIDCDNNNQAIANETNQTYTATTNGNYAVIITDGNCVDTSACLTVTGLSVDENDLQFFSVHPNPANEMLNLSTSENINQVIISTLGGQRVIMSHEKSIYVGDLDNGVYMITVFTDSKRSTKRFVKQ